MKLVPLIVLSLILQGALACYAAVITGPSQICAGKNAAFGLDTSGGIWSSSNPTSASVNAASGIVAALTEGATTISYFVGSDLIATHEVTVNASPSPITGGPGVCIGGFVTMVSTPTGGIWTNSNVTRASINNTSGVVAGLSAGPTVISYTLSNGCVKATTITVNNLPAAISGITTVCEGAFRAFSNATPGGTWSSSIPAVASVSAMGVVSGLDASAAPGGVTTISYHLSTGCYSTRDVTVNNTPSALTGSLSVCIGSTTTLNSTPGGGVWTSSVPSRASVNSASGVVSGITPGTATISYQSGGCNSTRVVTVSALPSAITGTFVICAGSTVNMVCSPVGGTWSSSNTSAATANTATGAITGTGIGNTLISYTSTAGCVQSTVATINAAIAPNTGTPAICLGQPVSTVILSNATPGGTWSTSNSARIVTSAAGLMKGISLGTANVTYSKSAGCFSISEVTVNAAVAAITGTAGVCPGAMIILASATADGAWSSSNTTRASVDNESGEVTGISAGTATITYMISPGCYKTSLQTVHSMPGGISGTAVVCEGATTLLTCSPSGGTWSSSNTAKATVSSAGVVRGMENGNTTITYQLGTGCRSFREVTVNVRPSAISGTASVCPGTTTMLTSTPGGGFWSSSVPAKATVNSATGAVAALTAGTTTISYLASGCSATRILTVNILPSAITGTQSVCIGNATTLSSSPVGGTWSSSNNTAATVNGTTGIVQGIGTGNTVIEYTTSAGCIRSAAVSVNAGITTNTGIPLLCLGQPSSVLLLGNATPGGTWSSSHPAIVLTGPGGVMKGMSLGTANLTYKVSGCYAVTEVTVNGAIAEITTSGNICTGSSVAFTNTSIGGTWSSSNTSKAIVNSTSGIISGISTGTTTISYIISAGCYKATTKNVFPAPAPITGLSAICTGNTTTLSNSTVGGSWSCSSPDVATINSLSGIVSGIATGTTTVSYSLSSGCRALTTLSVFSASDAGIISGDSEVLTDNTLTLTNATYGGIWSSSNEAIATISSSGNVAGLAPGSATISYTVAGSCGLITATKLISVVAASTELNMATVAGNGIDENSGDGGPATAAGISGPGGLAFDPEGNMYVASVTGNTIRKITTSGTISTIAGTGIAGSDGDNGPATAAQLNSPLKIVIDNTGNLYVTELNGHRVRKITPSGTITTFAGLGIADYSGDGGAATAAGLFHPSGLTIDTAGNIYIADYRNYRIRKVNPEGVISTIAGNGAASSDGDGGPATAAAILDPWGLEVDGTNNLYLAEPEANKIRKISPSGIITTVAGSGIAGFAGDGGPASAAQMFNCADMDFDSAGNMFIADQINNRIRKVTPSDTISTVAGTGVAGYNGDCGRATSLQINFTNEIETAPNGEIYFTDNLNNRIRKFSLASKIYGASTILAGGTITLTPNVAGGTWTSSNTALATIASTGMVTGLSAGTVMITYTVSGICGMATKVITVTGLPAITGTFTVCATGTTLLAYEESGGTWSSDAVTTASVNASSGLVTGIVAGTARISYTTTGGTVTALVTVIPLPSADSITGPSTVVVGGTVSLGNASTGGVWTSSNSAVATVNSTGIVTGIADGGAYISYTVSSSCGAATATKLITVTPSTAPPITGTFTICPAGTTTLTNAEGSGVWSSATPSVASVNAATGVVNAIAPGTATISYTVPGGTATVVITVLPAPNAGILSGASLLTTGTNIALSSTNSGGEWSSANVAVATIGTSGIATGITPGEATMSYTIINSCGTATATKNITVSTAISGTSIVTVAGNGLPGHTGNGGPATAAAIENPGGIAFDGVGNMYVVSYASNNVRKITPSGIITTIAGTGEAGSSGDNGPATAATLNKPVKIITDPAGNLYVSELEGHRIRKIAPSGIITTIAGTGVGGFFGDGGDATAASLYHPSGLAIDAAGNIYIADYRNYRIRKRSTTGIISTIAGTGAIASSGSGGPATAAAILDPWGLTVDPAGNLYIAEAEANKIRMIAPSGIITTYAGTGTPGFSGDNGPATAADLFNCADMVFDDTGNMYIADQKNQLIRKISPSGIITTIGGTGEIGYNGDCAPALILQLNFPNELAMSPGGELFFTDNSNNRVRKFTKVINISGPPSVTVGDTITYTSSVAGGIWSCSDTAIAAIGSTGIVTGIADGAVIVSYTVNNSCGEVTVTAAVTVGHLPGITGTLTICPTGTTTLANSEIGGAWSSETPAVASVNAGTGLVTGVTAGTARISYTLPAGTVTAVVTVNPSTVAGSITGPSTVAVGGIATLSNAVAGGVWSSSNTALATVGSSGFVTGIAAGTTTITYTVSGSCGVASVTKTLTVLIGTSAMKIVTIAGNGASVHSGDGGQALSAGIWNPGGIAFGSDGNTYVSSYNSNRIRKITPSGTISTIAGNGISGDNGDGGHATAAELQTPLKLLMDATGNLYVTELNGNRVRKISPAGIISTFAGNGTATNSGDGGSATSAGIANPAGLAIDAAGNIYISSYTGQRIRKVSPSGTITTVAGTGAIGSSGDGGHATAAKIKYPWGINIDDAGNLYIAESEGNRIRKVSPSGIITTYAGTGTPGFSGDGGPATAANLYNCTDMDFDALGNMFVMDQLNNRIRKISTTGTISTVAGTGVAGFNGDCAVATTLQINIPNEIEASPTGEIYFADNSNNRVRKFTEVVIISGAASVAVGSTIAYTATIPGGTWSSSAVSVGSVSSSGIVTGISAGTTTISYMLDECTTTAVVMVTGSGKPGNGAGVATTTLFSISPNPTSGALTILSGVAGEVVVYTIDGREITRKEIITNGTTLSLPSNLSAGIYMFRFKGADGTMRMGRLVYQP